ncbi:MAG TPA: efflux RND transporter periplasmic adaptor subunit [Rhodanobacteraceae bacterium]|nr:efflux RND transporter periplasmic adaptor subunit [Rhodanobacteraceae bacterium]
MSRSRARKALTLAALALAATACGNKGAQQQAAPPPVEVGVVAMRAESVPLTRDLVGRLSAFRSSDVRARVAGVLRKRVYQEGSDVKEGQLLFEIDPAPLKAALNASLATLAQAQATYTNNHIAAQRARELVPKGFVSKSDVDNAEAAERTAAASVKQAQANVDTAKINLGYASVTAPIAGRAGKQQVTEGALVGQDDATLLTTIDQIDPIYANFTLSVNDLEDMRRAKAAGRATLAETDKAEIRLTLPDGTQYGKTGTLDFSDTTVDPATGAVSLRGQIPNPDHSLLPGMYVSIRATLGQQHDVFKVPQPALQRDAAGPYVLVVGADNTIARKDVVTDTASEGNWIVTNGLGGGDQVIVSGVQRAKAGQPAKGTPWQPDAAKSAQAPSSDKPAAAPDKK